VVSISGTCSVRIENAGTSMSMSTPKVSRAFTVMSGASMAEVGRISEIWATLFIASPVP